jgi:hypothetical protein
MLNLPTDQDVMHMPEGTQPPPVTQETQATQEAVQPEGRGGRLRRMAERYSPSLLKKSKKGPGGSKRK